MKIKTGFTYNSNYNDCFYLQRFFPKIIKPDLKMYFSRQVNEIV